MFKLKVAIYEWLIVKIYEFSTSPKRSKAFRDSFNRNLSGDAKSTYETIKLNRKLRK